MRTLANSAIEHEYLELVRHFPLVSIQDDEHLAEAIEVIHQLLDKPTRTEADEAYLGALTDIVEVYENTHVHIPSSSGLEVLRSLVEENGLSENDLAPIFGTTSAVSEVLAGIRPLTLTEITRLADYFGVPADVFVDRSRVAGSTQDQ